MSNATDNTELVAAAKVTFGPMLVGTFLNLILFGVSVAQFYFYILSYKRDRIWMKLFIATLFVLDLINSIFLMILIYDALINSFGDSSVLQTATWPLSTDPLLTAIIAMLVQCFFAWRVKVLTQNIWIALGLGLISVTANAGGVAAAVAIVTYARSFSDFPKVNVQVTLWLSGSLLCDCCITGVLVWHLRSHKTGMASDDIVDRIIRMTVSTGAITSACAIVNMVVYLRDTGGWYLTVNFLLAKLYTNSLLSSLNSRKGWAYGNSSSDPSGRPSSGRAAGRRPAENISLSTRTQVFVNVESHAVTDSPNAFDETKSSTAGEDLSAQDTDFKINHLGPR